MKITLQLNKTLEQNAALYFEQGKKAKKKAEGAKKAVAEFIKKQEAEKKKTDAQLEKMEKAKQKTKREKKWYEKFRWFFTDDGFLCIGGRDATTNEIIIKKHTDKDDIVCHTDMSGSPFFVIKKNSQKKEIKKETIQQAIDATFAFSRAWKLGLMTTQTFYVKPEQVTKEPNSGEYLPKGAFVIRGKTNYLSPTADIAIGKYEDTIMCGPIIAVKAHCKEFLRIVQGKSKPSDVAKLVKKKFGGELDDIISALPPGNCDVKN